MNTAAESPNSLSLASANASSAVVGPPHREHGPEQFLGPDVGRRAVDFDDGRRDEVAVGERAVGVGPAAGQHRRRPARVAVSMPAVMDAACRVADDRTHLGCVVGGVTDAQRLGPVDQRAEELLGDTRR